MDYLKSKELREKWGNKECDHPQFEKETHKNPEGFDIWHDDYVCTQCGQDFTSAEYKEIMKRRSNR